MRVGEIFSLGGDCDHYGHDGKSHYSGYGHYGKSHYGGYHYSSYRHYGYRHYGHRGGSLLSIRIGGGY